MDKESPQNYTPQWETLRRYEVIYYVVWLGGAILALVLSMHFPALKDVFGVLWIAAFFAAVSLKGSFRCPRCGNPFFSRPHALGRFNNPFTRKCLHCGLPKWQSHG